MKSLNSYVNEWKLTGDSNVEIKKMITVESYEDLREIIIERYDENNKFIDLRDIDISNIDSFGDEYNGMYNQYYGYGLFYWLENVEIIDVTGWKTSKIENMEYMFDQCRKLKEIRGIATWDVSNVYTMENMFRECNELRTLNLSKWKPEKLDNAIGMFSYCNKLNEIKGIEKILSSHYIARKDAMFVECPAGKLISY